MFLTLEDFLDIFPPVNMSLEEFVKTFIVTYSGDPTLEQLYNTCPNSVIKSMTDYRYVNRDIITEFLYDMVIVNRHKYLADFYRSYFELPDPHKLKWDNVNICTSLGTINLGALYGKGTPSNIEANFSEAINVTLSGLSLQKNDPSRRIIRNLNYLDILHNTRITNTSKCKTSFWQTFIHMYNELKLEDRFFCVSCVEKCITDTKADPYRTLYYHFQQYQPKASILNPYTINWIIKNLLINTTTNSKDLKGLDKGLSLFTPVLSWASYICAFMNTEWTEYVGVDVMSDVCDKTKFLFDYYQTLSPSNKTLDLYCQPSESLLHDPLFMAKYANHFDATLMCPPYFDMEIYPSNGKQSTEMYPTYELWLTNYWENTVKLVHHVLKEGGTFAFIINDYKTLKNVQFPLVLDTNKIVLKYFKLTQAFNLLNRVSPLRINSKSRTEMLFIYIKTSTTAKSLEFSKPLLPLKLKLKRS